MMLGMNSALYVCGNMPVLCLYISISISYLVSTLAENGELDAE